MKTEAETGATQPRGVPGASRSWKRQGQILSQSLGMGHGPAHAMISSFLPPARRGGFKQSLPFPPPPFVVICYRGRRKLMVSFLQTHTSHFTRRSYSQMLSLET